MDGGQDTSPGSFQEDFRRHEETLRRHLRFQVLRVYKAWGRPLDGLDDDVQELLLGILKASDGYDPARKCFRAWAYKVAMYRLRDRQREFFREKGRPSVKNQASLHDERTFDLLVESRSSRGKPERPNEAVEVLLEEIERLPKRHQLAVRRRCLEDAEYASIAEELGVSVPRARHIVSEGLGRLSDRLLAARRLVRR